MRTVRTCSIDGCNSKHYGRGFCKRHHSRWYKHGNPHTILTHNYARPPADHPLWDSPLPIDDSHPIHTGGTALAERRNPALYPEHWPADVDPNREPPRLYAFNTRELDEFYNVNRRVQLERNRQKNEQIIAEYFGGNEETYDQINTAH